MIINFKGVHFVYVLKIPYVLQEVTLEHIDFYNNRENVLPYNVSK